MNRPIKFRAWDKGRKCWLTANALNLYTPQEAAFIELETKFAGCEIMQFTGLLDKNGKEIYEGDVIDMTALLHPENTSNKLRVMEWGHGGFNHPLDIEKCEIIGNIYENPELIKN